MQIAGFQKNSFVDYPGQIAAVVFCGGCNYNCWYCHNRHILRDYPTIDEKEVFDYLERRKGAVDAVVFSGGEATLQADLADYMKRVKDMGYLVKLDTNGANPAALKKLLNQNLIDYVAMDIKAPFDKYKEVTGVKADIAAVKESITILLNLDKNVIDKSGKERGSDGQQLPKSPKGVYSDIHDRGDKANVARINPVICPLFEFRTTCVPQFTPADIENIAKEIAGARLYALQQYRHTDTEYKIAPISLPPHEKSFFTEAKAMAEKYVKEVIIRGL